MSEPFFTDPRQQPDDDAIAKALGPAAAAWRALFSALGEAHPDLVATWRYYADGKSWLCKVARKATTVCWVSVEKRAFRVSFYFAERHLPALLETELSDERKAELRAAGPVGKLRAVTVRFGPRAGARDVLVLVAAKMKLR